VSKSFGSLTAVSLQPPSASGHLPATALEEVELRIAAPSLKVRDERQEAEIHRLEHAAGILSPQTWSQLRGLDYEQEQQNRRTAGEA